MGHAATLDGIHVKTWVTFAGCVLVVVVLYLGEALLCPSHLPSC